MKAKVRNIGNLKLVLGLLSIATLLSTCLPVQSALPPRYQNVIDLEAMTKFIKDHPKVASSLESVDVRNATVRFGSGCVVVFKREGPIVIGPAGPLVFKESDCPVD